MTIAAMTMAHIARGRRSPTDQEAVRCLQKHLAYTVKDLWKRFGW